jgi:hypothetical protein
LICLYLLIILSLQLLVRNSSIHLEAFNDFFLLCLILIFIIFNFKMCNTVIRLQLIHFPLSLLPILILPNVYASVVTPQFPLSTLPHIFVDLPWEALPPRHIKFSFQRVYMLCRHIGLELSVVAAVCWSTIFHLTEW